MIPCAAKRFSTQKTMCLEVIFFSSTRNGSTVLGPELYDDRENPFGPIQAQNDASYMCIQLNISGELLTQWNTEENVHTNKVSCGKEGPKCIGIAFFHKGTFQLSITTKSNVITLFNNVKLYKV